MSRKNNGEMGKFRQSVRSAVAKLADNLGLEEEVYLYARYLPPRAYYKTEHFLGDMRTLEVHSGQMRLCHWDTRKILERIVNAHGINPADYSDQRWRKEQQ